MTLILGVLGDSYRRQLRRQSRHLVPIDVILENVAKIASEFGMRQIGVDYFSADQLASKDPEYLDELKARLAELHMVPTVIVGTLLLHADREISEPALERTMQNLAVAHRLGSPLGLYYFAYGGRVNREGRTRLAIEQIRRLADAAQAYGIRVTTENYDFFTSDDFLKIFTAVERDNIGLHNDTGNWLLLGEDPLTATLKMAPYTYHAHVRDYLLRDGVYVSVPVGKGVVDFPPILAELQKIASKRERMILAMEMDLDEGDEEKGVRECASYMVDWFARNVEEPIIR